MYINRNESYLTCFISMFKNGLAEGIRRSMMLMPTPKRIPSSTPMPRHKTNVANVGIKSFPENYGHYFLKCIVLNNCFEQQIRSVTGNMMRRLGVINNNLHFLFVFYSHLLLSLFVLSI